MFCGECGTKNKKGDRFCLECGAPLVEEAVTETTTNVVTKPRQPMSKKNKIIVAVIAAVVLVLGIGYKVGSDMTNPKAVALDYIQASISQDGGKLYKYLELEGDKTFVSKKIFKELLKSNNTQASKIENYKITDVEYGDGKLTAKVKFTYTMKESSSEKTSSISLTKQKDKKLLFFDDWKITDATASTAVIKDYKIKVTKDSIVTYAGVKLTDKYLDKDSSTSTLDVYKLPQVFATKTVLKAKLPSGMEIEEEVTPSSYYSTHTVSFDEDSLTEKAKEKITSKAKEVLTTIYTNAIANKQFSDIKSNFKHGKLDLTDLETNYNSFLAKLSSSTNTLTSITFTNVTLSDLELNSDGYLETEVKVNYDYSISYTSWSDEVKTHSDSDYDYMTIILAYDKDAYYLVDIDELDYYFSRY